MGGGLKKYEPRKNKNHQREEEEEYVPPDELDDEDVNSTNQEMIPGAAKRDAENEAQEVPVDAFGAKDFRSQMTLKSDNSSRPIWITDIKHDIALLVLVEECNPYSVSLKKATPVWKDIAAKLASGVMQLPVTERGCRERTDLLLKQHRNNENLSVKASGVEEEGLNEVKRLLTSISSLEEGRKNLTSGMKKLYSGANRAEAEKIRLKTLQSLDTEANDDTIASHDEVLGSLTNQLFVEVEVESLTSPSSVSPALSTLSPGCSRDVRKRSSSSSAVIDFLKIKFAKETDLKQEELDVRKIEAENRRKELEMQTRKQESELEHTRKVNEIFLTMLQNAVAKNS